MVESCEPVEARHAAATDGLHECEKAILDLPSKIDYRISGKISEQRTLIHRKKSDVSQAESLQSLAKSVVLGSCTEFSLFSPPFCAFHLKKENFAKYHRCRACKMAHGGLSCAKGHVRKAKRAMTRAEAGLRDLQTKLSKAERGLKSCQEELPKLSQAKAALDAEWLPQKEQCHAAKQAYLAKQRSFIPKCAREMYDQSCEKACVESQHLSEGCGVVEGKAHRALHVRGGVEVSWAPPVASWIMGPFGYAEPETEAQQCERILQYQQPQFAQTIPKAGWLWRKSSTLGGWAKHFDAADQVRSAVLRFYEEDPSKNDNVPSSVPSIILWDAHSVKAKEGQHESTLRL